ncbi:hypothetical protein [Paractinoplanes durhamensis]|uniref:Uncharacterized protein n=1 Tax=Paractinoplanes durhamensis TaxID=113563 RepID=A0ABQ3YWB7_9ACTN|nr:hypothetical protein [Actinoplanes durhamensis]GIE01887.1 hypothetical protein Adu01nite_32370 [Actinoplanes durhamensis]
MTTKRKISHGSAAAASVVLGAVVGLLTNVITDDRNVWIAAALGAAVVLMAAIEVRRAMRPAEDTGREQISIVQRVRRLSGKVIGVRRTGMKDADVRVRQRLGQVEKDAEVVGYEQRSEDKP